MFDMFRDNGISDLTGIVILIVILLIVWILLRYAGNPQKRHVFKSTSLGNLRTRYLRGDISSQEYDKQKKDLEKQ